MLESCQEPSYWPFNETRVRQISSQRMSRCIRRVRAVGTNRSGRRKFWAQWDLPQGLWIQAPLVSESSYQKSSSRGVQDILRPSVQHVESSSAAILVYTMQYAWCTRAATYNSIRVVACGLSRVGASQDVELGTKYQINWPLEPSLWR